MVDEEQVVEAEAGGVTLDNDSEAEENEAFLREDLSDEAWEDTDNDPMDEDPSEPAS